MTIVGFNFLEMHVTRTEGAAGKINISNNVAIKDISERDLTLGSDKQSGLKFTFEFVSKYEPKVGEIKLIGDVSYIGDSKEVKKILEEWKKSKKINKEIMTSILNTVLQKCNIKALILSQDVNLPPCLPLPKVQVDNPSEN